MCGEHPVEETVEATLSGSSPHVRGTPEQVVQAAHPPGIIPACAGNTTADAGTSRCGRDHPRMCGEHPSIIAPVTVFPGLSPHVRGTPFRVAEVDWQIGIIPACAGNTSHPNSTRRGVRDHPRMCGEHRTPRTSSALQSGSSPHVRGTRAVEHHEREPRGIIPACAGNTSPRAFSAPSGGDHPRMCGEHAKATIIRGDSKGSSPHVRGTLGRQLRLRVELGIIPACAGNT